MFINWFHNPFFNLLLLNCHVLKLSMFFSCAHSHELQGLKINAYKFIIFQLYTNFIAFTFNFKNTNATPALTFSIFVTMVIMITITIIRCVQMLIYFENKFLLLNIFYISTYFHSLNCFIRSDIAFFIIVFLISIPICQLIILPTVFSFLRFCLFVWLYVSWVLVLILQLSITIFSFLTSTLYGWEEWSASCTGLLITKGRLHSRSITIILQTS